MTMSLNQRFKLKPYESGRARLSQVFEENIMRHSILHTYQSKQSLCCQSKSLSLSWQSKQSSYFNLNN